MSDQTLYHHGILGQKWGSRNGPPYPLSASRHRAVVKRAKSDRKPASSMSDEELRSAINRKRLENRYSDLTKKNRRTEREALGTALDVADKTVRLTKGDNHGARKGIELGREAKKDVEAVSRFNKGKSGKKMSDTELKKAVERLQLERDYNDLNPTRREQAARATKDALLVIDALVGTAVTVTTIAKSPVGQNMIRKGRNAVAARAAAVIMNHH